MADSAFRFKQFTVKHDRCAMKVGTDGVLLGAWASVKGCDNLLDVGTGSGLVAMMLAQRNSSAAITAIDIDEDAFIQAGENFALSPFSNRLNVVHAPFQEFVCKVPEQYDLIVSNPPFFANSILPPDAGRADARHSVSLTLEELIRGAYCGLMREGRLAMIIPFDRLTEVEQLSESAGFVMRRLTRVVPVSGKPAKRVLVELSKGQGILEESELLIEQSRHHYSPEFVRLVRDFYLAL